MTLNDLPGERVRITAGASLWGSDDSPKRRRAGPTPEDTLFEIVRRRWPTAKRNYRGAIPGRRFEVDIALVEVAGAIEVDGWAHHGRFLRDFLRDREKDEALFFAGWRVLRVPAGRVIKDPWGVDDMVARAIEVFRGNEA